MVSSFSLFVNGPLNVSPLLSLLRALTLCSSGVTPKCWQTPAFLCKLSTRSSLSPPIPTTSGESELHDTQCNSPIAICFLWTYSTRTKPETYNIWTKPDDICTGVLALKHTCTGALVLIPPVQMCTGMYLYMCVCPDTYLYRFVNLGTYLYRCAGFDAYLYRYVSPWYPPVQVC